MSTSITFETVCLFAKVHFRDIVSAPVMNRVWKKYGFDGKGVKFEDFCDWFSIVARRVRGGIRAGSPG